MRAIGKPIDENALSLGVEIGLSHIVIFSLASGSKKLL